MVTVTYGHYSLDHAASWIAEVNRGRFYLCEGNCSIYLETKKERLEVQGKKSAKLAKRLKDELEWMRSSAKDRQAKSKVRLERYEEMATETECTRKPDLEEVQIPPEPRLDSIVLGVMKLKKGFDGRVLIDGLPSSPPHNGIVGVVSPNGVGKMILFKIVVGLEPPDVGDPKVGGTVQISYVDQMGGSIDPEKIVR